jgi:anti-sigma B factor antagonist
VLAPGENQGGVEQHAMGPVQGSAGNPGSIQVCEVDVVDRYDNGQLLAAWVTAELRRRRQVADGAGFVRLGLRQPPPCGREGRVTKPASAPSSSTAPASSHPMRGGPREVGASVSGQRDNFRLRSAVVGGQVVLDVDGEVDVATAPEFERELLRLVSRFDVPIIVNLRSTTFFDLKGLYAVMAAFRLARRRGSDVALQAPSPSVRKILEISGADQLLQVID